MESTPGARTDLKSWLGRTELRVVELAARAGVGLSSVYRAINGRPVSLRVAQSISDATAGEVQLLTLLRGTGSGGTARHPAMV